MASKTEIANIALIKLGHSIVTDVETESNTAAVTMNALYDPLRKSVLRDHPWNFATKRTSIAADIATPSHDFAYQYTMPSDFLRLLDLKDNPTYRFEKKKILTDKTAPLYIKYIYDATDTGEFDDMFVDALAARMAMEASERLTQSATKRQLAAEDYKNILQMAKSADGQEMPQTSLAESEWITAREQGGNLRDDLYDPIQTG